MAKRRTSEVELCFDSMTDFITNLAGGLILLVLLLLGVTRESPAQTQPLPPTPSGQEGMGEKPISPLEVRVTMLRSQILRIEKDIGVLAGQLPQLRQEVEELLKKAGQVQPPKEQKSETEPEKEPKTVMFRPPLLRSLNKAQNIAFLCRENRLYLFDLDAYHQSLKARWPQKGETLRLASGDYDVRITGFSLIQKGNQSLIAPEGELILKAGSQGETVDQVHNPGSTFQTRLKQLNPQNSVLQFQVYPDSYAAFRDARSIAWEQMFDLIWLPKESGTTPRVGYGGSHGL
jgi:hypothetical protein